MVGKFERQRWSKRKRRADGQPRKDASEVDLSNYATKDELQKIEENAAYLENLIKNSTSVSYTVLFEASVDALTTYGENIYTYYNDSYRSLAGFVESHPNFCSAENLSVLSSLAQDESTSISKNVKWSVKKRFLNGTYKFSCAPYGYRMDENGTLAIVPEEAAVVRSIFESFVSGMGTHRIAKNLNLRHIPTRKGGKWTSSTLLGILQNERYVGDALLQKTYTDSSFHRHHNHGETEQYLMQEHHEPIIQRELFEQANDIIQQRVVGKTPGKYQNRYCFSGKIICGECGGTFKRQIHSNGVLWICSNHLSDLSRCSMKYIRDDTVKAAFATMINKLIFAGKQLLQPFLDELCHAGNEETLQRVANLKSSLEQNAQRKDDLRKLRAKGIIDSVIHNQELCRMEQQNDAYREELRQVEHLQNGSIVPEAKKLLQYVESADMLSEFSEELFLDFVENMTIYTRTCIGFQLKCGLTFKEELCLDTKLKTEMP